MPTVEPYRRKTTGAGKYRARLNLRKDPATGKYPKKSVIFEAAGLRDAKTQALHLEQAERARTSSTTTFASLAERWVEDNPTKIRASTMQTYRGNLANHILPRIGERPLRELRKSDFAALRLRLEDETELKPASINQCIATCRTICRHGVEGLGWLDDNPAAIARVTMPKQPVKATDPKDFLVVVASIKELDLQTMVVMAAMTGARVSELCGLQWSDLSIDVGEDGEVIAGELHVAWMVDRFGTRQPTKTHTERTIPLGPDAMAWLIRWRDHQLAKAREDEGLDLKAVGADWYLWSSASKHKEPSHVGSWTLRLKLACEAAGLPGKVKLHGLRHLAATLMINQGHAPTAVSGVLGHARTSMTLDVYAAPELADAKLATAGLSNALGLPRDMSPAGAISD